MLQYFLCYIFIIIFNKNNVYSQSMGGRIRGGGVWWTEGGNNYSTELLAQS